MVGSQDATEYSHYYPGLDGRGQANPCLGFRYAGVGLTLKLNASFYVAKVVTLFH